jgi:nicotinate-nucleotide adenylyltransferase
MSKIRLGVMGGTFDPIHFGHLVAASEAASAFDLSKVIFVPTGEPWQKQTITDSEHRYQMTQLAIAGNEHFDISRVDVDRPGPTYTVDTLRDIATEHPEAELFFITGADSISQIGTWKDAEEIWELAHFVGVTRPGHSLQVPKSPHGAVSLLEIPALAISSTDIRARVKAGKPIDYLLPEPVIDYIQQNNLYRSDQGTK